MRTGGLGCEVVDLEAFELVFLQRPVDPREYDEQTLERIQLEHLAFYESLREAGHVVTNGPVVDQPDESLRGLAFFRTGSVEKTRQLAEEDPAVKAGRLSIEVMSWWCRPGTMVQAGRRLSLPDP